MLVKEEDKKMTSNNIKDFSNGPAARNLSANAGNMVSIPHAKGQLILCATTAEGHVL